MVNNNVIAWMYHDVVSREYPVSGFQKPGARKYTLTVEDFEAQLCRLSDYPQMEYTFDDGGSSFLYTIAPVLEKYGKRGIFFIATGYIGTSGFLTEEEIRELDRRGHCIAAHSHTHPVKMSDLTEKEMRLEWKMSKQVLERIVGHDVNMAAVPGGAVSARVLDAMRKEGFTDLYTSEPTMRIRCMNGAYIKGRFAVTRSVTPEYLVSVIECPIFRMKLMVRYHFLYVLKWILGSQYSTIKRRFQFFH